MNRLSANTFSANNQASLSGERTAGEPKCLGRTEALDVAHLKWQVWKGYLLVSIIFGAFVLVPLNATGPLKTSVSRVPASQSVTFAKREIGDRLLM